MKIQTRESTTSQEGVRIAQNLKRESVTVDKDGNIIDPKTKRIIKSNDDKE